MAEQTNTAIPIEPAMITHTSGELLYFRTMFPSPTSDLLEQLLVSSGLSRWYDLRNVPVLVPGPAASLFRPAISMWSDKRDDRRELVPGAAPCAVRFLRAE